MKKFKITKGNRVYIVDAKSHIDAINRVKSIKDGGIDYGTLTIDLNSPNELTSSKIVQELKNEIGNNKIAEIRGGSFTPVSEHNDGRLDLDFKEFKNNEWGTNHITLTVRSSLPIFMKAMKDDPKYGAYKLRAELNNKLKQFANKTIYSNKSFTMDSAIRDYSPEVYIKELEKLIPEYQRLGDLKGKIRESLVTSGKTDKSKMGPDFKIILSDAKVQQWVKQVRELDKKWNNILTNLNRFGANVYKQQSNGSDLDVWLNSLPDSWTISDIKFAVKSESRKYRDSISQWKPGMSEIGLFQISYKKGTVNQSILVKAATKEDAINKFTKHKPDAEVISVNEYPNPHFGEPILDSKIKDIDEYKKNYAAAMRAAGEKAKKDQINSDIQKLYDIAKQYGPIRTEQNKLNNEFEQQNMQVVRNRFYNDPTVKRALKQMEDLDTKWNTIVDKYKVLRQYSIPQDGPNRFMSWNTPTKKWVDDIKKQLIKDSAIKDMPLMFKSNVNMQSLKSNIDNVKNKPNETYINSLNANIQGIIADIEEIKGYEKDGKFNESPALKFSCKNLTAQYYKLLNDPKLQGTLHKLDESTYKNVLYAEHQAQMLSQVTLKDSAIKDSYGWSYIMAPMKTPGDKDLNILRNLRSTYYDDMYQDVYNIRKAFAKATNKRVAINMAKDMPEYAKFIRTLDSADKDWNAIISKYPSLKKFKINTTGAERLLYGYYPTLKDFVDEITPAIKKEW